MFRLGNAKPGDVSPGVVDTDESIVASIPGERRMNAERSSRRRIRVCASKRRSMVSLGPQPFLDGALPAASSSKGLVPMS